MSAQIIPLFKSISIKSEEEIKLKRVIANDARIVRRQFANFFKTLPKDILIDSDLLGWLRTITQGIRAVYEGKETRDSVVTDVVDFYEYTTKKKLDEKKLKNFISKHHLLQFCPKTLSNIKMKDGGKPRSDRDFIGGLMRIYDDVYEEKYNKELDPALFWECYDKWSAHMKKDGLELKLIRKVR
jgi:hypothetical protein